MSARGPAPVIPASVARLDLDVVVETLGRHAVNVRIRDPQRPLHVETGQADWVLTLRSRQAFGGSMRAASILAHRTQHFAHAWPMRRRRETVIDWFLFSYERSFLC